MSFAVLTIPRLSLHALRRTDAALVGKPLAIIQGEGRKACILEASEEAAGVLPGFTVSLALARCPSVILKPSDGTANAEAQRILLASGFALSPRVEATAVHRCTVDLQGADIAQTEADLRRQISALMRAGLPARGGIAETPLLAAYAAELGDPVRVVKDVAEFLKPLPLATAEPIPTQAEVLCGWGIRTLGDLTRLTKADVGQRLGPDGVKLWERASGEAMRVLRLIEPPTSFAASWEYETPVENMEPLLFKLRRYAERVAFELRAAAFVADALTLTLFLEDETDHRRSFRLPEPGTDVDLWLRVILTHLETVRTDSRIIGVRLVASPARPPLKQGGLFDTGLSDAPAFWENLARVAAIVGEGRVGTPVLCNSHRPDSFTIEKPAEAVPLPDLAPIHERRGFVLRRLRPPPPVEVEFNDVQPCTVSGFISGKIIDAAGPWPCAGDWWKPEAWGFHRWQVELEQGGLYQLIQTVEGWAVEGVLD